MNLYEKGRLDIDAPVNNYLDEELTQRYEGIYLDKKIKLHRYNGAWEFVRFNGNLHIAIYPIGNHQFSCKWRDQFHPYTLTECDDSVFEFFGFKKYDNKNILKD